jgi:hypothetical protein
MAHQAAEFSRIMPTQLHRLPKITLLCCFLLSLPGCSKADSEEWYHRLEFGTPIYESGLAEATYAINSVHPWGDSALHHFGPIYISDVGGILSVVTDRAERIVRYEWSAGDVANWSQLLAQRDTLIRYFRKPDETRVQTIQSALSRVYGTPTMNSDSNLAWEESTVVLARCNGEAVVSFAAAPGSPAKCGRDWPFNSYTRDSFFLDWKLPQSKGDYVNQFGHQFDDSNRQGDVAGHLSEPDTLWGIPGEQVAAYDGSGAIMWIAWTTDYPINSYAANRIIDLITKVLSASPTRTGKSNFWETSAAKFRLQFDPYEAFVLSRIR